MMIEPEPRAAEPHKLWEEVWARERTRRVVEKMPLDEPVHPDRVRFVCISDTHNMLAELVPRIPPGDVLLHCGDFSNFGEAHELEAFNVEMGKLPHRHKIVIAGNHELGFEDGEDWAGRAINPAYWSMGSGHKGTREGYTRLTNCTYLQDSAVQIYGLRIYGLSWHPLAGCSFYRARGAEILQKWLAIPPEPPIDVLMTHTPPLGHSDVFEDGQHWGDADLLNCVERRIRPRVHVFGHLHEQPYQTTNGQTLFINAAVCSHGPMFADGTSAMCVRNPPVLFDLPLPQGHSKE